MADTVTVTQVFDGIKCCVYQFTNKSDGTGESAVKKIDLADLVGDLGTLGNGRSPKSLTFVDASWTVSGFNYVEALWNRPPSNKQILVMSGTDGVSLASVGNKRDTGRNLGGTGNILLTTNGGASGSSYAIRMIFKKNYN